jgi:hypothetical protein
VRVVRRVWIVTPTRRGPHWSFHGLVGDAFGHFAGVLGQNDEIAAFGKDRRIDSCVSHNESGPWCQSFGNLLTNVVRDLEAVKHACRIGPLNRDCHPLRFGIAGCEGQGGKDICAERPLGVLQVDRCVEAFAIPVARAMISLGGYKRPFFAMAYL